MAARRFSATLKASGMPSSQRGKATTIFFYLDSATLEADVILAAQALAGMCNGDLVSVSAQIYANDDGDYASATANGGSNLARFSFRDSEGKLEQIVLPLMKQSVAQETAEGTMEVGGGFDFLNRWGDPIGDVVAVKISQVAETAGA